MLAIGLQREEIIILVSAENEEAAYVRAALIAPEKNCEYPNCSGEKIVWKFSKVLEIQSIDGGLEEGAEIFSRLFYETQEPKLEKRV